ncbi:MAG: hypothetical protein ABI130_00790 [Leifsonia sp.]
MKAAAAKRGLSYSEYLRRELTRIAERMRVEERWEELAREHEEWVAEARSQPSEPSGSVDVDMATIVGWLHEDRDSR